MRQSSFWIYAAIALGIMAVSAAILHWLGRLPLCQCGTVKPWHGDIFSSENSQHLTDWYSPSHVVHGLLFYAVLDFPLPLLSLVGNALLFCSVGKLVEVE